MSFRVVEDQTTWNTFLTRFSPGLQDPYFRHEYLGLFQANGDGKAAAALFETTTGGLILYPFMKIPLREQAAIDLSSAYGYGGPLAERVDAADVKRFEDEFCQWCRDQNVVSEFIRFHPILDNQRIFQRDLRIEKNRETVCVDLSQGFDQVLRKSISAKTRNMIRKGEKARLEFSVSSDFSAFRRLYISTMSRLGAAAYYCFSDPHFAALEALIGDFIRLVEVRREGKVLASALFLLGPDTIHYHLSGSAPDAGRYASNDFLLARMMEWGCRERFQRIHLGGGTTTASDDSLLRFKGGFSPQRRNFSIGKRIHNHELYNELMGAWRLRNGRDPVLFQQYQPANDIGIPTLG